MIELTTSAIRFSWAMSLFGIQQFANIAAPHDLCQPTRKAAAAFYPVTQAIENKLGNDDLLFAAYLLGDDTQRALVDLFFDTLTLRAFTPGYLYRLSEDIRSE